MNKVFTGFAAAALLLGMACSASAANYDFYVRNRPFTGAAAISNTSVTAALDDILASLGYSWSVNGTDVIVSGERSSKASGPKLDASVPYKIIFKGTPVYAPLVSRNGRCMVDVKTLAKALGLQYSVSPATGSIDLTVPVSAAAMAQAEARRAAAVKAADKSKAGADDKAGSDSKAAPKYKLNKEGKVETDGKDASKSPILVDKIDSFNNYTGDMNTSTYNLDSVTLKNSGKDPIKGVSIKCELVNGAGDVYNTWTGNIGDMAPGATKVYTPENPIWYNNSLINVDVKTTITHLPPAEKKVEKEPAAAPAAAPAGVPAAAPAAAPKNEQPKSGNDTDDLMP